MLRGLDLEVEAGEFIVVMGPSGCGKSTLALALTGAASRLLFGEGKGRVIVNGVNALVAPTTEISERVGMVLQNPETQLVTMTVREELAFGPENLKLPPSEIEQRINEVAGKTRLSHILERPVNALSGGEKQAVAIASILTLRPKIVIIDEITSMLDPLGMQTITQLIQRMHQEHNLTILAIDHRVEWAAEIADRILVMNEGKIELSGSPRDVFASKEFVRKIGVKAPQVAEIAYRLTDLGYVIPGVPVTLDEAAKIYTAMLGERRR